MLTATANGIIRRLGDKVYQMHVNDCFRRFGEDGSYHVYYPYASCRIYRVPDNSVHVRILVPVHLGDRYVAHSGYFQTDMIGTNNRLFDKTIHHEGEEEELTSHVLELVALYLSRDAEK